MCDARGVFRRLNRVVRAGIPSAAAAMIEPPERIASPIPAETTAPMPSNWFRSAALLDVRGLEIGATAHANAPRLVNGVSLSITSGEVVGLVGDDSSGALQVAQSIAGVLPRPATIRSGSILFNGEELVGLPARSRYPRRDPRIAYVSRDPRAGLDPAATVGTQLAAPLRSTLGLSKPAAYERSIELLHQAGVERPEHAFTSFSRDLPPTMALRVQIAGALAGNPNLVVADDPSDTLTASDSSEIFELLEQLQHKRTLTMIIVTRSMRVAARICHRVAVVRTGGIVEYASVADLFDFPKHPYTRELLYAAEEDWPGSRAL
ncbi:ATP-binding cassette domain-containing protein [Cryobacterium sp. PH31-O1]|uniref:ATP-binding cassette domain-containing protein n=1 Tax=Cryobacterium sp. PH31-O1 TaxID=3046306 RepID=UPI0024BBBF00|nr:ATP-binding cassette domain-containing protein [Cryobacterium sp. PH31-O1]MDJ0338579.1 ATP-binding cassette domain-containing protein [Cryobacterium sp. PH31-O1]